MKGLIIDTTGRPAYAVAFDGDREEIVLFSEDISTESGLIPACSDAFSALGMDLKDADGVFAVVGPGSFTGIRIGVTFINAIAYALKLPRFALTSFDVMESIRPGAPAYAVDAGHDSFYASVRKDGALFQENLDGKNLPEGTVYQSDLTAELPHGALIAAKKALEEKAFSTCAPTKEREYLKPEYMRRSQAERLWEEKK